MNTQPANHDDGQTWHFPGDLAALVSLPFITLAFSFLFTWLTSPAAIIWVAALPGFVGLVMLIRARLPLYRQHQFLSFGPRGLDAAHRRLYWKAYAFIAVSVAALTLFIAIR